MMTKSFFTTGGTPRHLGKRILRLVKVSSFDGTLPLLDCRKLQRTQVVQVRMIDRLRLAAIM